MTKYLVAFAVTLVAFLALDFVWLTQIARKFYADRLGTLLLDKPNLAVALAFYAMFVVGIVVFVVGPALRGGSIQSAALYGALFGLVAYATYDMTNYATLKDWPVSVVIVDMAWGAFVTAACAAIGVWATQMLVKV